MTTGGSIYRNRKLTGIEPQVMFSSDGRNYTAPQPIQLPEEVGSHPWLWRVTWHEGTGYGIVYAKNDTPLSKLYLVKTDDGIHYSLVKTIEMDGFPNESTVRFLPDGRMAIMVRRDAGDCLARILGHEPRPLHRMGMEENGVPRSGHQLHRALTTNRYSRLAQPLHTVVAQNNALHGQQRRKVQGNAGAAVGRRHKLPGNHQGWRRAVGELLLHPRNRERFRLPRKDSARAAEALTRRHVGLLQYRHARECSFSYQNAISKL